MKRLVVMPLIVVFLAFALGGCLGSKQISKKEGYETSKPKRVTENHWVSEQTGQPQLHMEKID